MATPTVFVSSTFYDLRYLREGLKRFIESLGYSAVLSEDGTVFYDPKTSAAEACLVEVGNVDILVLIIGGRYGSPMPDGSLSVTNAEYQQAVKQKIPVFALVEQGTHNDYQVYRANTERLGVLEGITFPHADTPRIFEFMDEVQGQATNNAIVPFGALREVEEYLRNQWAGMMHSSLSRAAQEAQVVDSLDMLGRVNARIELLAEQILRAVGTPLDRVVVRLLQQMVVSPAVADLRFVGAAPSPADILQHVTAADCAQALGRPLVVDDDDDRHSISGSGDISGGRYRTLSEEYVKLRSQMLSGIAQDGVTVDQVVSYEQENPDIASSYAAVRRKDISTTEGEPSPERLLP